MKDYNCKKFVDDILVIDKDFKFFKDIKSEYQKWVMENNLFEFSKKRLGEALSKRYDKKKAWDSETHNAVIAFFPKSEDGSMKICKHCHHCPQKP